MRIYMDNQIKITQEIKRLRQKLEALNNKATLWVISDIMNSIHTTLFEQTGLKMYQKSMDFENVKFIETVRTVYQESLRQLLEAVGGEQKVEQLDLETAIRIEQQKTKEL